MMASQFFQIKESMQSAYTLLRDLFLPRFQHLLNVSATDLMSAILTATKEQEPIDIRGTVMEVADPVILGFIHYSEWIVASYGGLLPFTTKADTVFSIPTVITGDEAYLTFLLDSIHVARKDLLFYCLEGDPITTASSVVTPPPYFVLVDHQQMAITLLVRGTKNINEIVIDMSVNSLVWENGFVHEGIGLISKMIANEPAILESIRSGLEQNPGYGVKTVGHSLGAGIAALVAILWNTKHPFGEEVGTVECFAFASPPILTMSVKNRGEEFVHCLVNEDDIVPRLSVTCIDELMDRIQRIIERNESSEEKNKATMNDWIESFQGVVNTVKRGLDSVVALADSTMSAVSSFVGGQDQRTILSVGEELDSQIENKKRQSAGEDQSTRNSKRVCEVGEFYLPGTVFYYHPYIGNEKEYKRYEMQKSCFGSMTSVLSYLQLTRAEPAPAVLKLHPYDFPQIIRLSPFMMWHHFYYSYEKCLRFLCDSIRS